MSQQYPQNQQHPYQGGPAAHPGGPVPPQQPQPKKSWFARHKVLTALGGVFAFFMVLAIATSGGDVDKGSGTAATAPQKQASADAVEAADDKPAEEKRKLSQADRFKAFVAENGTAAEKAAAEHVTKVQGADGSNGILDAADVYTDFTGGMMGPHQGEGKLLASAFADWKDSENGLVTVYDEGGEILSNGNY